jgi:polysaccharide export outer membrane protein
VTPDYRVAPGDVLQVFVWKEPELSREVRVRPDGYLTVPLVGDLFVVGKTPRGLAAELAQQLGQYVTGPVVTVTLKESIVLRFFVVGEVGRPGEFPLLGRTTVMQAFALAGGFREYAKTDEVKILRQELQVAGGRARTQETVLSVNYKSLAQGQNLQQNLVLKPGDVIVVP